jgi:hypothetical protein
MGAPEALGLQIARGPRPIFTPTATSFPRFRLFPLLIGTDGGKPAVTFLSPNMEFPNVQNESCLGDT